MLSLLVSMSLPLSALEAAEQNPADQTASSEALQNQSESTGEAALENASSDASEEAALESTSSDASQTDSPETLTEETAKAALPNASPTLVYEAENLTFPAGTSQGEAIPSDKLSVLSGLHQGTIDIKFTPQISGIHTLLGISNGVSGNPNSYYNLYIAGGKAGFEIRRQSGGDYEKPSVSVDLSSGDEQHLAMTADPSYGYRLFLNGSKVLDLPNSKLTSPLGYGFIDNIPGVDSGFVGKTKRTPASGNANEYPFFGTISSIKVYDQPLSEEALLEATGDIDMNNRTPVRKMDLFQVDDWNSPAFRIPSMLVTDHNVILAVADIRYGNSNDSPNNIDTGIRTSNDGGVTWSDPRLILNFLDYPNKPTSQITDSASFIDPVMVKGDNNRVFLFVDVIKGGFGQGNAIASSGFADVGGQRRLRLQDAAGSQYTVGADQIVYDSSNAATSYSIGKQFALLKDGNEISNIFYSKSPLTVLNTTYVCMTYSDDDGQTWSDPKVMDLKTEDMKFFGVAPGVGIQMQNGSHAGRIMVPMYYTSSLHTTEYACVVYSDDNGETWIRGGSPNDNRIGGAQKLHESQIVEMPDGQLKMYARSLSKASVATSFDGGETWDSTVELDSTLVMSSSSGCQLSIINYSKPIQGKPAVIFCNPAATTRSNGTIRVGLIEENGTYENGRTKYRINWISSKVIRSGEFAYSCLTELPNSNLACLYEENNTRFTLDHLVYAEYTPKFLLGGVPMEAVS